MKTEEIIKGITSRDSHEVWKSACQIIEVGQNHKKIEPFIEFLPLIIKKTKNLNLGGMFASNQRFVDFAIKTIEFHKNEKECYCGLYIEKYILTNDIIKRELQYECFNPRKEVEKGNINIMESIRIENKWIDYYIVECEKCKTKYKVEEREGHYMFWDWNKISTKASL